jgi:hypothetical protein
MAQTTPRKKPPHTKEVGFYYFDELDDKAKEKARDWWRQAENECFDSAEFTTMLEEQAMYHHRIKADSCYWSLSYCQGDGVAFYGTLNLGVLCADNPDNPDGGSLVADRAAIAAGIKRLESVGFTCSCHIGGSTRYYSMHVQFEAEDGPEHNYRFQNAKVFFDHQIGVIEEDWHAAALQGCEDEDERPILIYLDWLEEHDAERMLEDHIRSLRLQFRPWTEWEAIIDQVENGMKQYMQDVSRDIERIGYAELEYQQSDEVVDDAILANEYEFDERGNRI